MEGVEEGIGMVMGRGVGLREEVEEAIGGKAAGDLIGGVGVTGALTTRCTVEAE